MLLRVEHIGIAVKNLEEANALFARLFGKSSYKQEEVASESVTTSFFGIGQEAKIELLESGNPESAISKFITKRGEGIHHLAFEVDDIYSEMDRLRTEGFELLMDKPKEGADNKLICFLHPRSTQGILVELCQEKK